MKLTLTATLAFFVLFARAQQPPDFNATKAAGIITYDTDKVIKKLKVDDEETQQQITKYVGQYNLEMYQLQDKHAATLIDLDAYFDRQVKVAMQRRDRSQMDPVKSKIKEVIPPIKMKTMEHEKVLNAGMESTLDEKQYAKWLRYQKSLKPAMPAMGG